MLQLAACGGPWPEQRRNEAFLQDHAICPRCDTAEIETEEHRFYFCKGNTTGDLDLVDLVAKTDWILPEARVGLTLEDPDVNAAHCKGKSSRHEFVRSSFSRLTDSAWRILSRAVRSSATALLLLGGTSS